MVTLANATAERRASQIMNVARTDFLDRPPLRGAQPKPDRSSRRSLKLLHLVRELAPLLRQIKIH